MLANGTRKLFEYHCLESMQSADSDLWLRSHRWVTVVDCENFAEFGTLTFEERVENGTPLVYGIVFGDGHLGSAFEDELLNSEEEFCRPAPHLFPARLAPPTPSADKLQVAT